MITPVETAWHISSSFLILTIGLYVVVKSTNRIALNKKTSIKLYLWHTMFCIIYMYYTLTLGGDSLGYYEAALEGDVELAFGTHMIEYLTFLLVSFLGLSYLGLFLFFNILGSIGLIIFYATLSSTTIYCKKKTKHLVLLIIFLPSLSFWSSALGKDPIAFLSTTLALWSALNLSKRNAAMAIAIILMLLVRPHIAGIMVMALSLSMLIANKKMGLFKRVIIIILILPIAVILVPFAANYAGLENFAEANTYIETRQSYNMEGGGTVDISSMSYPMQVFTYLFRPLPYEAHSVFAFMSSLDNLIMLMLFMYAIRFTRIKSTTSANHAFIWSYVIGTTLVLAMTTANLGISVRQKWMIMPMLLYLLFAAIAAQQARKQLKKERKTYVATPHGH